MDGGVWEDLTKQVSLRGREYCLVNLIAERNKLVWCELLMKVPLRFEEMNVNQVKLTFEELFLRGECGSSEVV
ncbi:MAG: hypothetical protein ACTS7I_00960 [Candidatus Hodgkinia cicadicola]